MWRDSVFVIYLCLQLWRSSRNSSHPNEFILLKWTVCSQSLGEVDLLCRKCVDHNMKLMRLAIWAGASNVWSAGIGSFSSFCGVTCLACSWRRKVDEERLRLNTLWSHSRGSSLYWWRIGTDIYWLQSNFTIKSVLLVKEHKPLAWWVVKSYTNVLMQV